MTPEDDTIRRLTELSRSLEVEARDTYDPDQHLVLGPEHQRYVELKRELAAVDQAILRRALVLAGGASEQLRALSRTYAYDNVYWMAAAYDQAVLVRGREEDDPVEGLGLTPVQEAHLKALRYARGRRGAAPELLDEATDLLIDESVDLSSSWRREGTWYADHEDPVIREQQRDRRQHPQGP